MVATFSSFHVNESLSIYRSIHLSICPSVCPSVCLSPCLSVHLPSTVYLAYLTVGSLVKISQKLQPGNKLSVRKKWLTPWIGGGGGGEDNSCFFKLKLVMRYEWRQRKGFLLRIDIILRATERPLFLSPAATFPQRPLRVWVLQYDNLVHKRINREILSCLMSCC